MLDGKEIVYPLFLECCAHATDEFWRSIFEDLSYGKPPYGTYISKGFLCCSYKGKEFSYKIEKIPSTRLYTDIQGLLIGKLGILSSKERTQRKILFDLVENNIKESRQTWIGIKKKNVKDFLIEHFVLRMQRKYHLTVKQAKKVLSFISIALMFKVIKNKDITYDGHRIVSIAGISFKKGYSMFASNILMNKEFNGVYVSPEIIQENHHKHMSANWIKFLKKLEE
jgi:hypothetical protein